MGLAVTHGRVGKEEAKDRVAINGHDHGLEPGGKVQLIVNARAQLCAKDEVGAVAACQPHRHDGSNQHRKVVGHTVSKC